ncbi:MAG: hypothetical protein Q7J00_00255 [Synergistaceae bacterium]|nr:hypothetical protein [Synergistaceae bacterium]
MGKMVDVYVLKLFAPLDEGSIKGSLSELEYDDAERCAADLGLFRGKKINFGNSWQ